MERLPRASLRKPLFLFCQPLHIPFPFSTQFPLVLIMPSKNDLQFSGTWTKPVMVLNGYTGPNQCILGIWTVRAFTTCTFDKKVGASGLQESHAPAPVPFITTFQQQQESVSVTLPTEGRSHWVKEPKELQLAELMDAVYSKAAGACLLCARHYVEQVTSFLYHGPLPGFPTCLAPSPLH